MSIVETVLSIVLVGGLLVASLNAVGGASLAGTQTADRGIGYMLGAALMTEIIQQNYRDPGNAPLFGVEPEDVDAANATRTNFDDVDDYHNFAESPPEKKGGKDYVHRAGWTRTTRVELVRRADVSATAVTDEGLKRITITVSFQSQVVATLVSLVSDSAQTVTKGPHLPIFIADPLEQ